MADVAELGFSVDSSQLERGIAALNKFNNASKALGSGMTQAAKVFAGAVAGMNQGILAFISSSKRATTEQIASAKQASDFANKIYEAAKAQENLAKSVNKATNAIKLESNAMKNGSSLVKTLGDKNKTLEKINSFQSMTSTDKQVNRFNVANIAAQFQDIGVTAAMGMNPLTVALQQGTQLSAIINTMEKPLKGLAEAFKSIINPVSLFSIGLTALAVVGIQTIDWVKTGVTVLDALSSGFEYAGKYANELGLVIAGLSVYLLAANANAILLTAQLVLLKAGVIALTAVSAGLTVLGTVVSVITNPWVLLTATIIGAGEAILTFKDEIKNGLNSAIQYIVDFVNKTIGYFIGLKNVIKKIPEIVKTAWSDGLTKANDKITEIMNKAMNQKYISDEAVQNVQNTANGVVDAAAKGVETVNNVVKSGVTSLGNVVKSGTDKAGEFFNNLKNKFINNNEEMKKNNKDTWADIVKDVNRSIESINLEKRLYTADPYTQTYEQTLNDLMNKALDQGVNLQSIGDSGMTKQEELEELAKGYTDAKQSLDLLSESTMTYKQKVDFAKSATKGFFSDMKSGLQEGKSAWESFGNAVFNVLNKITDKMMDLGIDMLFAAGQAYFGGNISSGSTWNPATSAPPSKPIANAKGGVYSNGIVNSPTLFTFAKGGKFGVMGEAGPEAVMPLKRGPDGSLGVRADGGGFGSNVVVNVINNSDSQARTEQRQTEQGTEIDVIIDKMVADKMSQPGTSSNSALRAFNNQQLVMR